MANNTPVNFFSFSGGLNTEATPLSIKPEDLLVCENARILRNGSVERRSAINYITNNGNSRFKTIDTTDTGAGVNATYDMWDVPCSGFYAKVTNKVGREKKFLFTTLGDGIYIYDVDNISSITDNADSLSIKHRSYSATTGGEFTDSPITRTCIPLVITNAIKTRIIQEGLNYDGLTDVAPGSYDPVYYKTFFCQDKNYVFVLNEGLPVIKCTYNDNDEWEYRYLELRERDLEDNREGDSTVYRASREPNNYGGSDVDYIFYISNCIRTHTSTTSTDKRPGDLNYDGDSHFWDFLYTTYTSPRNIDMPKWRVRNIDTAYGSTALTSGDFSYRSSVTRLRGPFSNGTTAFGRLWLCGCRKRENEIFFSQMVINEEEDYRYAYMYQKADPRSQYDATPVDTDGGTIIINDATKITNLLPYRNGILVFATNGVWFVGGVQGSSFKPTAYSVEKISDLGAVSPAAVVKYENIIFYFSNTGGYIIQPNEQDPSTIGTTPITDKILTKYLSIPISCKETSLASYNAAEKRLYFWYNTEEYDWLISNNRKKAACHLRNCLVFDIPLLAWYEYSLVTDNAGTKVAVSGMLPLTIGNIASLEDVVASDDFVVTDNATNDVTVYNTISTLATTSTNLLFLTKADTANSHIKIAFGLLDADGNTDFSEEGTDEESFDTQITFAHVNFNDILIDKSIPYIQLLFKRTETGVVDNNNVDENEGGAKARFIFDWASGSVAAPKYGDLIDVYMPDRTTMGFFNTTDPNIEVVTYRHKLRGRGKSVKIELHNDGDRPFSLYGYQMIVRGNRGV